jgi:alanine dehydrogenase
MEIGIPKENGYSETRVALVPLSVRSLVDRGNKVFVEKGAGAQAGFTDSQYEEAGAVILPSVEKLFASAKIIVKILDLAAVDLDLINDSHIVLAFFRLNGRPEFTQKVMGTKATCISYEHIVENNDAYILRAMSSVCGKMAVHKAGEGMQMIPKGGGKLLTSLPGIEKPTIMILGAGNAGFAAAENAVRNGNRVYVFDKDYQKLEKIYQLLGPAITTLPASTYHFNRILPLADVIIGAVHKPYSSAPLLIDKDMLQLLRPGSVVVDLTVEQGGCIEAIRPTTLENPFYEYNDILYCAVPNLAAAVPNTSSLALNGAIYPVVSRLAKYGLDACVKNYEDIRAGVQLLHGRIVSKALAEAMQEKLFNLDALTLDE